MHWIKSALLAFFLSFSLTGIAAEPAQTINLNTASAEQLSQLSGIGKAKAEAIVQYREQHGKFSSADDLIQVKGIGTAILEKNRSLLVVE